MVLTRVLVLRERPNEPRPRGSLMVPLHGAVEVLALHIVVVLVSIGITMRRHSQHEQRKNEHIIVVFIFLLLWCTLVSSLVFLASSTALDHRSP